MQRRSEWEGTGCRIFIHIIGIIETIDPVDACSLLMEPVVFQFIGDVENNEYKTGQSNGQSTNINEGKVQMTGKIPDGNKYIMP